MNPARLSRLGLLPAVLVSELRPRPKGFGNEKDFKVIPHAQKNKSKDRTNRMNPAWQFPGQMEGGMQPRHVAECITIYRCLQILHSSI